MGQRQCAAGRAGPHKLPEGTWGAACSGAAAGQLPAQLMGREIVVKDRAGLSWPSRVLQVLERDDSHVLVRDTGRPASADHGKGRV